MYLGLPMCPAAPLYNADDEDEDDKIHLDSAEIPPPSCAALTLPAEPSDPQPSPTQRKPVMKWLHITELSCFWDRKPGAWTLTSRFIIGIVGPGIWIFTLNLCGLHTLV